VELELCKLTFLSDVTHMVFIYNAFNTIDLARYFKTDSTETVVFCFGNLTEDCLLSAIIAPRPGQVLCRDVCKQRS
jgi:hypothetical protein